jgi:excisionase family DNA binding protein
MQENTQRTTKQLLPCDPLLRAQQVAKRLGVPVRTIRHWALTGNLPGFKIGPRQWFFRESALLAFLEKKALPMAREVNLKRFQVG